MNQTPESLDESRRRITEHHRRERRKRLDVLEDDIKRWMAEGRNLMWRVRAEKAGDDTTVAVPRLR
jgi:hypothetical protein